MPFQSNTNFNAGPFNRTQEVFNIQPVVPMHLNEAWNLISRTIIPLVSSLAPKYVMRNTAPGKKGHEKFRIPLGESSNV